MLVVVNGKDVFEPMKVLLDDLFQSRELPRENCLIDWGGDVKASFKPRDIRQFRLSKALSKDIPWKFLSKSNKILPGPTMNRQGQFFNGFRRDLFKNAGQRHP
jgi:hypothetical protein